jgi:hypothetical protein
MESGKLLQSYKPNLVLCPAGSRFLIGRQIVGVQNPVQPIIFMWLALDDCDGGKFLLPAVAKSRPASAASAGCLAT